uniref:hypothetical protein n=1 Tax=Muriicola sp. TaxID=2020856 RepID=UPI003568158A
SNGSLSQCMVDLVTARVVRSIAKAPDQNYSKEQLNRLIEVETHFARELDEDTIHKLTQS